MHKVGRTRADKSDTTTDYVCSAAFDPEHLHAIPRFFAQGGEPGGGLATNAWLQGRKHT